jgi:hypothetical protein
MDWLDDRINRISLKLFGLTEDENYKVRFSSQNLNEDRKGKVKGWAYHGRCWLRVGIRTTFQLEWNLWSRSCGIAIGTDDEDRCLKLHFAIPPVSFWLTLPVPKSWAKSKPFNTWEYDFFEIRVFDRAIWWKIFHGGNGGPRPPKWREGCWHPLDTLLGRQGYKTRDIETKTVYIPMPEGKYEAKATLKEAVRKRPRWFGKTETYVNLDIDIGIPHEGKGTAEYNCGEDSLHGISGDSYEHAIARAVQSVLESRRKYDGNRDAVYPTPEERLTRITELRKKHADERAANPEMYAESSS